MSDSGKAVFLSYASQDAEAAKRIADALRAAGVEVWFDAEGGLEHGDEWDAKIRRQIKECVLFLPIISANTQAREEGYFRIEWELAAQRALGIASGVAFILPIVIDDTKELSALVPDRFRTVQWTRLRGGEVPPDVRARFLKLWSHRSGVLKHEAADASDTKSFSSASSPATSISKPSAKNYALIAAASTVIVVGAGWWMLHRSSPPAAPVASAPTVAAKTTPAWSEADQLAARAYALFDKISYTRDNLAAAEDLTRRATEIASDSAHAWAARAFVQSCYILRGWDVSEKRRQDTQTFANRALALNPKETDAMVALTYLLNRQGAFAQAEALARRALAVGPDSYRLHSTLISAIVRQGRWEEAFKLAAESVRLFPREPLTHYELALSQLRLGHMEEGLASFEAALAVQPFASALLQKAVLLVQLRGDVAAARATLNQVAPEDRTEDRAVGIAMWLALVEHNPARVQEAAALTARSYFEDNIVPGAKAWFTALAYQLDGKESLARQQWQAAETVLRQRLRDHPDSTEDHARLAAVLAWLGRGDEAAREIAPLEATMREQPNFVSAILLAQYYAALGQAAKAAPLLAQAMDRRPFISRHALRLDPQWDKLRGQPAFEALLAEPKKETAAPVVPDDKSVAVLAFANLSDDKGNEYFSDGISEELLNVLAKIPGLKVSARTSAFYFKGKQVPLAEIAQKLGVAYVVEGSVRKQGDKVRITAQLIKAADGFHVWSDTFTRDLKDIFAVQDEIAGLIAQQLQLKLGTVAGPKQAVNPEAYGLVLEGRHFLTLRTTESFDQAERAFTAALKIDPQFAQAQAGLAATTALRGLYRLLDGVGRVEEFDQLAIAQSRLALQMDPSLAEPHATIGFVLTDRRQLAEAEQEFQKAFAANPNYATAYHWHSRVFVVQGRLDLALKEIRRATVLDPLSFVITYRQGFTTCDTQQYAEALAILDRAASLRVGEEFLPLEADRARVLFELGRKTEALAVARKVLHDPRLITAGWYAAGEAMQVLHQGGEIAEATRLAESLIPAMPSGSYQRGYALCALGNFREGLPQLATMPVMAQNLVYWHPMFDPVRDTPEFRQLLVKLNCVEEYKVARATLARMLKESEGKKPEDRGQKQPGGGAR